MLILKLDNNNETCNLQGNSGCSFELASDLLQKVQSHSGAILEELLHQGK